MIHRFIPYGIILLFLLPILVPLYSVNILGSADNLAHLFRVVNLDYALGQGYVWPRWAALAGHGFGAPIFNFNYVLPYYICVVLWHIFGSLLTGSQVYMMLVLTASGFCMYRFLSKFFFKEAAIIGSVAYVYMPYHLMTVYLYGGYGEALAYVWVPLICTAIYQVLRSKDAGPMIPAIVYLSLLILTHNLSAVMTIGLLATIIPAYWTGLQRQRIVFMRVFAILAASILITTWFWLPAVAEQHMTKLGFLFEKETALRGYFFDLIAPVWENSYRALLFEAPGYYSYAIGIPAVIMAIAGMCIVICTRLRGFKGSVKLHEAQRLGYFFLSWYILSFFMTRKMSEPIWDLLPARTNFLSYPYRFFFINTFAAAGITAFVIDRFFRFRKGFFSQVMTACIAGFFVWQGWMYAHPAIDTFPFGPEYFTYAQTVRSAPHTYKNMGYIEFIPTSADSNFVNGLDSNTEHGPQAQVISGRGTVRIVSQKAQRMDIDVAAQTPITLIANILYFPGWVGTFGGMTIQPAHDAVGRIRFMLPAGTYRLEVIFRNTPIRTIATIISIASSICFVFAAGSLFVKNRQKIARKPHSS